MSWFPLPLDPESGRQLGLWLREVVRAAMNYQPDPPGEAVGGEIRLRFDESPQSGTPPAGQQQEDG